MNNQPLNINDLSPHLFWDVKRDTLDAERNKRLIIERVIQRGNRNDLDKIISFYGKGEIREIMKSTMGLNPRDMAFVHVFFDLPLSEMRCYTQPQYAGNY
jgi:hypothetical protein